MLSCFAIIPFLCYLYYVIIRLTKTKDIFRKATQRTRNSVDRLIFSVRSKSSLLNTRASYGVADLDPISGGFIGIRNKQLSYK
jgi:hypothetical protein